MIRMGGEWISVIAKAYILTSASPNSYNRLDWFGPKLEKKPKGITVEDNSKKNAGKYVSPHGNRHQHMSSLTSRRTGMLPQKKPRGNQKVSGTKKSYNTNPSLRQIHSWIELSVKSKSFWQMAKRKKTLPHRSKKEWRVTFSTIKGEIFLQHKLIGKDLYFRW